MIPLYILGLLQRFGPQHGYQLKKIIGEQLSDFTQIKLPTIYYHLEKMEADGLLAANSEKPGGREKTIYTITDKGIMAFKNMIAGLLEFEYRSTFPSDGVFYFSDYIEISEITKHLMAYIDKLKTTLSTIEKHKKETMHFVPEEDKIMVNIIFSHHEHHYQAERDWAEETLNNLNR